MMLLAATLAWALSPAVTPEEQAELDAGGVVLRNLPAKTKGAIRMEALIDIAASRVTVWDALLDFDARMGTNKTLRSVETYRAPTETERWIKWTAGSFGLEIVYHNHYLLRPDDGVLIHELDPTQINDMTSSHGEYRISPSARGTLVEYDVESAFAMAVPGVVQRWLTGSGLRDFLLDIARRAGQRAE